MAIPIAWLNCHHLLCFWSVVRGVGAIGPAATTLRLSQSTVLAQIHALRDEWDETLFDRQGRRQVLTDMGRVVCRCAREIFSLGREPVDTVERPPTGRRLRLNCPPTRSMR